MKESTAFALQLSKNFMLALLLYVSLYYLSIMASSMVRKDVGNTPGSCQNDSEKRSEGLVVRAAPTTNIGSDILGTSRPRCIGALGRNFPCYVACNFLNPPCDISRIR